MSSNSTPRDPAQRADRVTTFLCGPSQCEHDYSGQVDIVEAGRAVRSTAVCAKCGRSAYDAAQWL